MRLKKCVWDKKSRSVDESIETQHGATKEVCLEVGKWVES